MKTVDSFETSSSLSSKMPWFNPTGEPTSPFIVGIAGASASGKTSVSKRIIQQLGVPWVTLLCMDSFYNRLTPAQIQTAHENNWNFDHPDAFDLDLLYDTLLDLKKGRRVQVPVYDFNTHSRLKESTSLYGANVIIFEGIFALFDKRVRDLMDLKIFVDTDADVCLGRRLKRDIAERGRDVDGILMQYSRFVKPSFDDFVFPTKKFADVIVPRGLENTVAIDLITRHVQLQLDERGYNIRSQLLLANTTEKLPEKVLRVGNGIDDSIKKFIAGVDLEKNGNYVPNAQTSAHNLSRVLLEKILKDYPKSLVGVTILNGGKVVGDCLKSLKPLPQGELEIEISKVTLEPGLKNFDLPSPLNGNILLMDDIIETGSTAIMAIRVILDHHVNPEKIIYCCLAATYLGISNIKRAFPEITIYTNAVVKSFR